MDFPFSSNQQHFTTFDHFKMDFKQSYYYLKTVICVKVQIRNPPYPYPYLSSSCVERELEDVYCDDGDDV